MHYENLYCNCFSEQTWRVEDRGTALGPVSRGTLSYTATLAGEGNFAKRREVLKKILHEPFQVILLQFLQADDSLCCKRSSFPLERWYSSGHGILHAITGQS